MNHEYDNCRHAGCTKKVLNKTGLCSEHRKQKCAVQDCKIMITGRQGGKLCASHAKRRSRQEVQTWDLGASI